MSVRDSIKYMKLKSRSLRMGMQWEAQLELGSKKKPYYIKVWGRGFSHEGTFLVGYP